LKTNNFFLFFLKSSEVKKVVDTEVTDIDYYDDTELIEKDNPRQLVIDKINASFDSIKKAVAEIKEQLIRLK